MIRGGTNSIVLVVGTEKLHYVTDYTDRTTCVLFGDGAGAVVLEPTDEDGVGLISSELGMDGTVGHVLEVPIDGTVGGPHRADPRMSGITMEGQEVFRRAVTTMSESTARVVADAGVSLDEIDLFVPHQANARIIDATAKRLGVDSSRVYVNIHSYGNTSAATIPVALSATLAITAFGGGLSWGSVIYRWGDRVEPMGESDVELPPTDLSAIELLQDNFDFFGLPEKLA
jgi:3-oxoacyl-[acyl-carrier-protein] synthase-3